MRVWALVAVAVLAFLPVITGPLNGAADQAKRGRLPDGRAYRTAADGVEMVDYVAELELTVDELNRRVHGLEDELAEKASRIERLQASGLREQGIKERDLLGADANQPAAAESAEAYKPVRCPQPPPCPVCAAGGAASAAESRRDPDCQRDLASVRDEADIFRSAAAAAKDELILARARIESQSREVERLKAVQSAALRGGEERTAEFQSLLNSQSAAAAEKEAAAAASERKAAALQRQVELLERRLAEQASAAAARAEAVRVEQPKASISAAVLREAPAGAAAGGERLSAARIQAVSGLKSSINSGINQLRGLVAERDRRFREYQPRSGALRFKPRPAVSSRGYGLDEISRRAGSAQSVAEMASLDRDLRDIRIAVKDDLTFIERMRKGGR